MSNHRYPHKRSKMSNQDLYPHNRNKVSNQDWYLYMQNSNDELHRINISKLIYENSRPQLEGPQKIKANRGEGSKLFYDSVTNTIQKLELPGHSRDTKVCCDIVTTIDAKFYVLVTFTDGNFFHGRDRKVSRIVFQVYDPFHGLWKVLPNPPISGTRSDYYYGHFEWGHRLGISMRSGCRSSYVFDTIEEKWMPAVGLPHLDCAVEYSGFLIGIESRYKSPQSIVAYKLDDENGLPDSNSKHTLDDELWEIFYPPLSDNNTSSLTRFGDDRAIFLSTADSINIGFIVVAVFRLSISTVGGLEVVSAVFEHKQLYERDRYPLISSNFLMQDAPSYGTHIPIGSLPPIMLDDQFLQQEEEDDEEEEFVRRRRRRSISDDDVEDEEFTKRRSHDEDEEEEEFARRRRSRSDDDDDDDVKQTFENKLMADVEWDVGVIEKSLYLCFVENQTDSSVSYIIKAMKFNDLISKASQDSNSKLRQVASTSGSNLASLPCCGVFGSQILFAAGGDGDKFRVLQPVEDDSYSDVEDEVEVAVQQVSDCRDIHCYDVKSNDPKSNSNIKRFTKLFKGMKPQPVLAEVEGKLYALAGSPKPKYINQGPFFEVFDSVVKEWSPLPDPPPYTKFKSSSNYHAIAGTNILAWGNESPGVFRFDMAADSVDKDWRLIKNSGALGGGRGSRFDDQTHQGTIAVDSDGNGGGDFVLFTYNYDFGSYNGLQVHLISREFDNVACLPSLKLPKSVSSFLEEQGGNKSRHIRFVDLGDRRVCLVLSSPFRGPYSRSVYQLAETDKMSIVIVVFEFEVAKNRKSVAAKFVFQRMLEYDTNSNARRNSKTSDAHMVGAFLV